MFIAAGAFSNVKKSLSMVKFAIGIAIMDWDVLFTMQKECIIIFTMVLQLDSMKRTVFLWSYVI